MNQILNRQWLLAIELDGLLLDPNSLVVNVCVCPFSFLVQPRVILAAVLHPVSFYATVQCAHRISNKILRRGA